MIGAMSTTTSSRKNPSARAQRGLRASTREEVPPVSGGTVSDHAQTHAPESSEPRTFVERPTVTVSLPAGWARAALAGIEGALLGWGIPALAFALAYLAVAANPWLKDSGVGEASRMGAQFWAASLGVQVPIGPVSISFIPLLWTLVQIVALRGFLLTTRTFGPAALWVSIPFYLGTAVIISAASGAGAPVWQIIPGSLLVAVLAVLWAVVQQSPTLPLWVRSLEWVWAGLRSGVRWVAVAALAGTAAVIVAVIASWEEVSASDGLLAPDVGAGLGIGTLQVMYGLVYVAWALAWLAGPGFTFVGAEVSSPTSVADASGFVPIAAAVPESAPGAWVLWILVGAGLAAGGVFAYKVRSLSLVDALRRGAVAVVAFAVLVSAWMWTATGSLGEDRLALLGPRPWSWLALTGLVAGVAWASGLALHPGMHAWALDVARSARARFESTSDDQDLSAEQRETEAEGSLQVDQPTTSESSTLPSVAAAGRLRTFLSSRRSTNEPPEDTATGGEFEEPQASLGALRENWVRARQQQDGQGS